MLFILPAQWSLLASSTDDINILWSGFVSKTVGRPDFRSFGVWCFDRMSWWVQKAQFRKYSLHTEVRLEASSSLVFIPADFIYKDARLGMEHTSVKN